MTSAADMMASRQAALDAMADLPGAPAPGRPFADIRVDLGEHSLASLARAVSDRLVRTDRPAIGPDAVLFVNNSPDAGILHGVTPVVVADRDQFVREFHRCSVKPVRRGS